MAAPLVGRATGMLGNLQVVQMMAEMVAENILDESDSTSFVTTWRNSNSRTMTDARLTLQEIFDFVEKGLAPHPPQ